MSRFTVQIVAEGRCRITHELAHTGIITDLPPEYGGEGRSFFFNRPGRGSSRIVHINHHQHIVAHHGHDPRLLALKIKKTLSKHPKLIQAIEITIRHRNRFDLVLLQILERASLPLPTVSKCFHP